MLNLRRAIRTMEVSWYKVCGRNFALTSRMVEMPNGGYRQEPYYELTEEETLYIATKFNDEARAKLVLSWIELKKNKIQVVPNWDEERVKANIAAIEGAKRLLNLSEVSVAQRMNIVFENVGQPLIDYVSSEEGAVHSATYLLKANNVTMTARDFNRLAQAKGVLVQKTRPSHNGERRFWCISDDFLSYGRNDTTPQNPKETQPNWYDTKFNDLLTIINS